MRVKSILNQVEKYKDFVYERVRWKGEGRGRALEVEVRARAHRPGRCSGCGEPGRGYDRLPAREFEYVPLWGMRVYFLYALRRVQCARCGVKVEAVPWGQGKQTLTRSYMQFLATWARRLSWQEVARFFHTSWEQVFRSVCWQVEWGLAHRDLSGIQALGIDETAWQRGHRYLTVVYQLDAQARRLLWVGEQRTAKTLLKFFRFFGPQRARQLRFICSDLWWPYLKVIAKKAGQALHVLDRFHVAMNLNQAVDQVRAEESKELRQRGLEPILTRSRWCLLKRPEHLTPPQEIKLADLLRSNLRHGACLPAQGRPGVLLDLPRRAVGATLPEGMVPPGPALADRTSQERGAHAAGPRTAVAELVSGEEADLQRPHRRPQQPFAIDAAKSLWLSHLPRRRSCSLPYPWRSA